MAVEIYTNNATTTVTSGGATAGTSGTLESWGVTSSSTFPTASAGVTQFHVGDPAAPSELIAVTNVAGTAWTVTRGAESTTPVTHAPGFTVDQVITGGGLNGLAPNPMNALGDMIYGGTAPSAGTPARVAGGTIAQKQFLSQTGTGSVSATPGWSVVSGQYLCTPVTYAPGTQATLAVASTSFTAFSSANVNTGSFLAPSSGVVIVTAFFTAQFGTTGVGGAFGLCAHGGTSPLVGNSVTVKDNSASNPRPYSLIFPVTGLNGGTSYNFDLMGAMTSSDTLSILAIGGTAATPNLSAGSQGGPVVMIVQAV